MVVWQPPPEVVAGGPSSIFIAVTSKLIKSQGGVRHGKGTAMIVSGMEYGDERKRTVDNVSKTWSDGIKNRERVCPMINSGEIQLLPEWCPA